MLDAEGRVAAFAQDVKACALGQAAAGVLGEAVIGATLDELVQARDAMQAMLKDGGEGPAGRFQGLRALKQVADYPARHASTMVAIEATLEAVRQAAARDLADTRTSLAGGGWAVAPVELRRGDKRGDMASRRNSSTNAASDWPIAGTR